MTHSFINFDLSIISLLQKETGTYINIKFVCGSSCAWCNLAHGARFIMYLSAESLQSYFGDNWEGILNLLCFFCVL